MSKLRINTPEVFEPLLRPSRYKGVFGGRGSGKSHFFAELGIELCILRPGTRMVCVREVQKALKESAKRLIEDKIQAMGVGRMFGVQSDRIKTPGDGLIIFQGMQDHTAESVKSLEGFHIAWVEEAQTLSERSLELLRPTMFRVDRSEIWASWNPRSAKDPIDMLLRGMEPPPDAIVVRTNYDTNPFFPEALDAEREFDKDHNPDRYAHIWLGEYEPQAVGAIWNRQNLHDNRRAEAPDLERILVGVDHAVSDTDASNEHGISVGGLGADGRGYLLEDASLHGSPHQWATRAVAMFDKWEADGIVIERNQGGDLVRHTLGTIRRGLPIIEVHATRGKHVRAAPISALYAVNKISHVGTFPELEDQYCRFTSSGYEALDDESPDRAESAIWLFTELFPKLTTERSAPEERYHAVEGGWMG